MHQDTSKQTRHDPNGFSGSHGILKPDMQPPKS